MPRTMAHDDDDYAKEKKIFFFYPFSQFRLFSLDFFSLFLFFFFFVDLFVRAINK